MKLVSVAVGVVLNAEKVFVCLRPSHVHQGGKWEFPGGKVESHETPSQALKRELFEEIGIRIVGAEHLMDIRHDYGDKCVNLHVFTVNEFSGEAEGKEGQQSKWLPLSELNEYDFPEANKAIIHKLQSR